MKLWQDADDLVSTVVEFAVNGFRAGDSLLLMCSEACAGSMRAALARRDVDLDALEACGRLMMPSAQWCIERLSPGGRWHSRLLSAQLAPLLDVLELASESGRVRAFQEVAQVLRERGQDDAAVELEDVWNIVLSTRPMQLLCGHGNAATHPVDPRVRNTHARVVAPAAAVDPAARAADVVRIETAWEVERGRRERADQGGPASRAAKSILPAVSGVHDECADEPGPTPAPRTVLLVEDDEYVRSIMRSYLIRAGYLVLDAGTADAAEAVSRGTHVDALVTDVILGQRSGEDLAEVMRARQADLPLLFVSGRPGRGLEDLRRFGRPWAFLAKPFRVRELTEALDNLFASTTARPARA